MSTVAVSSVVAVAARARAMKSARKAPIAIQTSRRAIVARAGDLEPDNISVLVCGGNGVAMDVFRQLTEKGT